MSETHHEPEPKNFAPKDPPKLDPPRDDPISPEELARYDGKLHAFYITCSSADQEIVQARVPISVPTSPSRVPSSMCQARTPISQEEDTMVRQPPH